MARRATGRRTAIVAAIALAGLGILALVHGKDAASTFYSRRLAAEPALILEAVQAGEGSFRRAGLVRYLRSEAGATAFLDAYLGMVIESSWVPGGRVLRPGRMPLQRPLERAEVAVIWVDRAGDLKLGQYSPGSAATVPLVQIRSGNPATDSLTLKQMHPFLRWLTGRRLSSRVCPHLEFEVLHGDRALDEGFERVRRASTTVPPLTAMPADDSLILCGFREPPVTEVLSEVLSSFRFWKVRAPGVYVERPSEFEKFEGGSEDPDPPQRRLRVEVQEVQRE